MAVESLTETTYFGSSLLQYITFFAILTVGAVVGRALSFLYERRLRKKAAATGTEIDDIVARSLGGPISLLGVVVAAALGRQVLTPTPSSDIGPPSDRATMSSISVSVAAALFLRRRS